MTIGPAPMIMTVWISVRLGIVTRACGPARVCPALWTARL